MRRRQAFVLLLAAAVAVSATLVVNATATPPPKKVPKLAISIAATNNNNGTYTLTVTGNDSYGSFWPNGHIEFACSGPLGSKCSPPLMWRASGVPQEPPIFTTTLSCGNSEVSAQAFDDDNAIKSSKVRIPC
jgi:hypothetical protein